MKRGFKRKVAVVCVGLFVLSLSSLAYALPALQLGPGTGSIRRFLHPQRTTL